MVRITVFWLRHTYHQRLRKVQNGASRMWSLFIFPSGNMYKQLTNCIFESYTKVTFGTSAPRVCRLKLFQHVGIRSGYHIQGQCLAEWTCWLISQCKSWKREVGLKRCYIQWPHSVDSTMLHFLIIPPLRFIYQQNSLKHTFPLQTLLSTINLVLLMLMSKNIMQFTSYSCVLSVGYINEPQWKEN
jgi:hypothetical protein